VDTELEAEGGKSPVQQKGALAQAYRCAQGEKSKSPSGKNKIKTPLTRPASLEMTHYPRFNPFAKEAALAEE
jgi:hypothetical protein